MERIKALNRYQQMLLILLVVMLIGFTIAYVITTSRVGIVYKDSILVPSNENGNTVYVGRVEGEDTRIVVTPDNCITIYYEDSTYGPYTIKNDPSAKSNDHSSDIFTGVEIMQGDSIVFRGSYYKSDNLGMLIYDEEGFPRNITMTFTGGDGEEIYLDGTPVHQLDQLVPSTEDILSVYNNPTLTHKGEWVLWLCGVFVSILAAVSILYADEIFRFNLAFQIRNVESVEPSGWEIGTRYFSWIALTITAIIAYVIGLNSIV